MKSLFATTLLAAAASAGAVPLVGLTSSNELALFDSSNVAAATMVSITGLAAGDRLVGIDLRPKNSLIYGVSLSNKIYTVNQTTGAASFVVSLDTAVVSAALGYGIDFNPVADFGTGASLRLVSSAGNNYAINASTGVVGNLAGVNIGGGFTGVAYSNSVPNPSAAPASTKLYYINSNADTLSVATTGFNAPVITTVGALGVDVLKANGFEVLANGMAFAALNVDGSSLTSGLYSIDLATGAATSLGTFNGTLSGLTVAAVPEPQTYALFGAGLLALGAALRKRKG